MREVKRDLESAVPFGMEPVVYDFAINEHGSYADLIAGETALMPSGYYALTLPALLRKDTRQLTHFRRAELDRFGQASRTQPELSGMVHTLFDHLLPKSDGEQEDGQDLAALLGRYGFDRVQHEQIRADLLSGRVGLAQNRLPVSSQIEDVGPEDVFDATAGQADDWRDSGYGSVG